MTTRIALVGAGFIGKRHASVIAENDSVELVAIVDPIVPDWANDVPIFTDMASMLSQIKVDGVIVATPTEHHLAPTLAALNAGAHVLIEKPITATQAEAEAIEKASADAGLHVLVGHHRRYYSIVEHARDMILSGSLGKLVAVSGQWTVRKPDDYFHADWRKARAAGPVLTNLVHEIDCLRYICGDIESISAQTSSVRGHEKEDAAALVIQFKNGALGSFVLSDATPSPWTWEQGTGETPAFPKSGQNTWRLMGTKACLEFPNLKLWKHALANGDWTQPIEPEEIPFRLEDAFAAQCAHYCAVIRGEEKPKIDALDAARTLRATLAVFDAAESGKRVEV